MLSKCIECGSKKFAIENKDLVLKKGNPTTIIVNSECIVCKVCGKQYYNSKQMDMLDEKLKGIVI